MKKALVAIAIAGLFLTAFTAADNDAVTEFRKITWGTMKDSVLIDGRKPEFVRDRNTLIKNAYSIVGDDMTIGTVKLDKVLYVFNDEGRFYKAYLQGTPEQAEEMKFILTYKFGDFRNESYVDDSHIMQWLIKDVTFTLKEVNKSRFELTIESNWQASESYKKNTSVDDF